jgi:hypothetical protein
MAAMLTQACADASPDTSAKAPQSEPPQEIHVTVTEDGFDIPGQLESEPVRLMLHNAGKVLHHTYFALLDEGVTEEDLRSALSKGPDELFPFITIAGSMPEIEPMEVSEITMLFPEGNYVMIDPEVKGPPPLSFFTVTPASGPDVEVPVADYLIETGDFYFNITDPISGEATVEITNVGQQNHEVGIGREVGGEEKEVTTIFAPAPGGRMWTSLSLKPGDYTLVCFLPDPKTGKQHVKLGMKKTFTVD